MNSTTPIDDPTMRASQERIETALKVAETSLETAVTHLKEDTIEVKDLELKIERYNALLDSQK